MEYAETVRFSDHPRPFRVRELYCSNPECDCFEVILTFEEISEGAKRLTSPIEFSVCMDLDDWTERHATDRPPHIAKWVREFIRDCPAIRRTGYQASHREQRAKNKLLYDFRVDPDAVLDGLLVSYPKVLSSGQPKTTFTYTYDLEYQGRQFAVEDLYCVNPRCACRSVKLQFYEMTRKADGEKRIRSLFMGEYTFTGQLQVFEQGDCGRALSRALLDCWLAAYPDEIDIFEGRYDEMKAIGQRSLDSAPDRGGRFLRPTNNFEDLSHIAVDDHEHATPRAGRNDPCPCGSGRKFKKCCWRRDAESDFPAL